MLLTVGHSTRSAEEFVDLLRAHGVRLLVDVRRFPGSRRHPWFNREALRETLEEAGIAYRHAPELGGRRGTSRDDSPNTAWRNDSFRAYADHMASPDFRAALQRLLEDAGERRTAVMCAEAVPWRCHRQLISDAVVAGGGEVLHVLDEARTDRHALREEARVAEDGTVTYPGPDADQRELFGEGPTSRRSGPAS